MKWLYRTALTLAIIGAVNWLLVGLFSWDLLQAISGVDPFRSATMFSRVVYSIVGLAGLYLIPFLFRERLEVQR